MNVTSAFLLEFDSVYGPKVIGSVGKNKFSENEMISLQCCSFPDTVIQSDQESTLFIFKISKSFCYAMYVSRPDSTAPRGHKQNTLVIASELPYIYPFTRLLQSSLVLGSITTDILTFIEDFLTKWFGNFPLKPDEVIELPMFDGSMPISYTHNQQQLISFYGGVGWTPLSKIYYLNDNFLGFDLTTAFSLQSLLVHGRSIDILKLWEVAILNESLLVYGSTPTIASSCVLALESLIFPELPSDSILPFISVSDTRFQNIKSKENTKNLIIGVSNPIAMTKSHFFDHIFSVGFHDESNGFGDQKQQWNFIKECKRNIQEELRQFFYFNTLKLTDAITQALDSIRSFDPYAEFLGQIDDSILESQIKLKTVQISFKSSTFAKKLLRSSFLSRIWKRYCTIENLISTLEKYDISKLCNKKSEHELVDILSNVMEVKQRCESNSSILKFINRDYEIIKTYLASDLILAPV
ncbi:hypothetical protein TVAG_175210 [Trichomonas vaginalis G3]|uniref:UDENN domain-containing protein n=1 Tax=Trichomonas vaginalis (strain ATCC PRA-98 / G3) TaxID=412133 RepID=A2FVH9_TRIV3|nr:Rab guanyl-nucleotide exchange factor protein [Trichomonas vaginalis G3]EAX91087.1 hypothetical protein TVAG_175210 [Trichomonas vaginalis G3]KAI5498099.1 Rab guanyl-nucleotide exchange factor protein [Trichomonas vaginalis G3]|eukprot:XP_001304017.1 hypothetical protein [Trichomonas vaginalis G3]